MKRTLLKVVVGGVVVLGMIVTAPFVLKGVDAMSDATPDEEAVCGHLTGDLGLTLTVDCPSWLSGSEQSYGDYYPRRLRCMHVASNLDEARRCDDMVHLGTNWSE